MARLTEPKIIADPSKLAPPPLAHSLIVQVVDNHWRTAEVPDPKDKTQTIEQHTLTVTADAAILVNRGPGREAKVYFSELAKADQATVQKAFAILEKAAK